MANIVTISGMFGDGHTYFADSPVVIDISGLEWPSATPFSIVRLEVVYNGDVMGDFRADTNGHTEISLDISSALRVIWSDYNFETSGAEVATANAALAGSTEQSATRDMCEYSLRIYTEYMSSDDGGVFTVTQCQDEHGNTDIPGGQCLMGALTEWERSLLVNKEDADVSHLEHSAAGIRHGDASTKPLGSLEIVGRNSITSWVDVQEGFTKSIFYPAPSSASLPQVTGESDDIAGSQEGWTGHSPMVLRDSVEYVDFLFVNRRGAVETCSARMEESLEIEVETTQYARVDRPSFRPSRSIISFSSAGRRSWNMSSGHQTREWVEWWTLEFLMAQKHWMLYKGRYVPVAIAPSKKSTTIYDKSKQQMGSVEFTVTLALEG